MELLGILEMLSLLWSEEKGCQRIKITIGVNQALDSATCIEDMDLPGFRLHQLNGITT